MYCKKCHTLMEDGEVICNTCGYDNSKDNDVLEETKEININPKEFKVKEDKKKIKKSLIIIIILLIVGGVSFYIINDSKSIDESKQKYNETDVLESDKNFSLDGLSMSYPSSLFGASKSTIFYKNNNAYNIEIKEINVDEYNNMRNNDFVDKSILGKVTTYTHASKNSYEHILENKDKYYIIIVNYVIDDTLENTKIQLDMMNIINSLSLNE